MQDGRVIVTGGQFNKHFNFIFQQSDFLTSTEIFDPATNTWAMAGNMQVGRSAHTTTLLPNGKVLVVGGTDGTNALSDAELLDPITRVWTKTGPMLVARARHQTTLLSDGKVLISGGNDLINSAGMKSCELFDPTTNLFSATGDMKAFHDMDSTVLMGDGRVLAGSGYIWEAYNPQTREWTSLSGGPGGGVMGLLNDGRVIAIGTEMAVSLFEPATNTWTDAGSSGLDRWDGYSVTVLKNGKVLVVGGLDHGFAPLVQADLYDPIARTWSRAGALNLPRSGHDALALVDGRVLITSGGEVAGGELYDPTSNTWSMSGIEATQRYNHTSTRLLDGRVLVAGGDGWSGWASSSVFDPVSSTWKTAGNMAGSRSSHTATLLGNGKVLVTGGLDTAILPLATAELFDPGTGNWSSAGSMQTARWLHTSTLLPDGRVMVTGGSPDTWASSACGSVEIYDPVTNLWKQAADMSGPRVAHAAALLPSGHVLVAGCGANMNTSSTYSTAESYDPITNTWSAAASPQFSRYGAAYTAVPLRDGKVLFIGGDGSRTDVQGYDPVLDKWTQAASPIAPHNQWFTASLLPDGKVLLVGGTPETHSLLDAAEVYDPVLDLWLSTGSLVSARSLHTATLLNDGRVMVVGGINGYIPEFWKP
jgi:N-acetylneuraminic acid mutarotase